jgi:FkbM family methyltransferase
MFKTLKNVSFPARRAIAEAICPSMASYSAAGEDLLAWGWISRHEPIASHVRYLDIGAAHPKRLSNTFMFYRRGGSGVLVEPDPDQVAVLRDARPRDTIVNAGAAFDDSKSMVLTKMTSPLFNTFSPKRAAAVVEQSRSWPAAQIQRIVGSVEVEVIQANRLLATHFDNAALHFLSIDAEGVDFEILKSIDFRRFSPWVVCIEAQASVGDHLRVLGDPYRLIYQGPDNFMFSRID